MEETKAMYGGSFDPITNGHISIIHQAQMVFDKVIIVVATNPNKKYMFSIKERVEMIESMFAQDIDIDKTVEVIVLPDGETLVEKAYELNCFASIRGVRSSDDYTYENELAATNYYIESRVKTVMFFTEPSQIYVSSSRLKTLVALNKAGIQFAPSYVIRAVRRKLKTN